MLDLLAEVAPPPKLTPKALIAPHSRLYLLGSVAAAAFATLRDSSQAIKRVVLMGPAHYFHVRGIAAPTVSSFETPLGRMPVDLEALSGLADLQFVKRADAPHTPEHCLEVELPFLQTVLASFQIVPLVVGDATPNAAAQVLRRLWAGRSSTSSMRPSVVTCSGSFLALVLKTTLEDRIAALGRSGSWPEIIADLDSLTETEIEYDGKRFIVRSAPRPASSLALRAAGVALPPTIRDATVSEPSPIENVLISP